MTKPILIQMLIFVAFLSACKKNVPMNFDATLQPPTAEKKNLSTQKTRGYSDRSVLLDA